MRVWESVGGRGWLLTDLWVLERHVAGNETSACHATALVDGGPQRGTRSITNIGATPGRAEPSAARWRWTVIRNFITRLERQSCALAAVSSSALAPNRRKIIRTSILTWVMPMRSFALIARRYSASILFWAHTKQSQLAAVTMMPISRIGRRKCKPQPDPSPSRAIARQLAASGRYTLSLSRELWSR